ncbi:serine/threonine-protein kinase [Cryptosporangium minutisporangium]
MRVIAGRYELQRELGVGGMGAVWLGRDQVLGRSVAIKEVRLAPVDAVGTTKLTAAAFREARTAAALSHTHIVPVYDVVEHRSRPWIVMLAIEGPTLLQRVLDSGPLDVDTVATIGASLASALDAAHEQGIVHRDVKPANVLLATDDHPWLTDFGIAQTLAGASSTSCRAKGSPGYAAPEQVRGEPPGPAVDVFGLGATLYYAVEGEHAFSGDDGWATLMAPEFGVVRTPERAGWLEPILLRMLARRPADRPTLTRIREALRTGRLPQRRGPVRGCLPRLRRR